ncbi:hypothetical protein NL676_000433 [Syzygium grande]|nr:hypothetical protein NL676_000433 [Syzygium grande]
MGAEARHDLSYTIAASFPHSPDSRSSLRPIKIKEEDQCKLGLEEAGSACKPSLTRKNRHPLHQTLAFSSSPLAPLHHQLPLSPPPSSFFCSNRVLTSSPAPPQSLPAVASVLSAAAELHRLASLLTLCRSFTSDAAISISASSRCSRSLVHSHLQLLLTSPSSSSRHSPSHSHRLHPVATPLPLSSTVLVMIMYRRKIKEKKMDAQQLTWLKRPRI